ncbi:MAG: hypothetical protein HFH84_08615 [Lachnospiraceae bacterium]|nr:hypothetical protein [Lachnospiraceae bacterium]
MRKIVYVLAGLLCCLLGSSFSARADVIWEPEDSFYWKHAEECTYVSRMYTTNGPDNKVISYKSPELPQEVDTWENGVRVQILFTYEDSYGNLWGIYDDYRGTTGWIPMEYMELVYDSIAFREEHEAQIIGDVGDLDEKYVGETIYLWEYPGSEEYTSMEVSDYTPEYRGIYVDGNGKRWGCVQYYFGIKNTWVYIDEPTADFEQIFPEGVDWADADRKAEEGLTESREENTPEGQEAESRQAESQKTEKSGRQDSREGSADRIVPKLNRNLVTAAVVLVISVVAVTAALLVKLKGGRK